MFQGEFFSFFCYFLLFLFHLLDNYINFDSLMMIQIQTSLIIYIGCINSSKKFFDNNNSEIKPMNRKDALLYAIKGSLILFGIYLSLIIFNHNYINFLFSFYFIFFDTYSISSFIKGKINNFLIFKKYNENNIISIQKIPFLSNKQKKISQLDIFTLILGFIISIFFYISNNWILNNFIGIILCLNSIENIYLGEFKIALILLSSLFIYDIFFVYFTNIMKIISLNLDIPLILKFPNTISKSNYNTIGLGDIIIPGFFISLMLRFDIILFKKNNNKEFKFNYLNLKYFFNSLIGYIIGIFFTISIMIIFKHSQPALLFIVPILFFNVFITSLLFGEYKILWNLNEISFIKEENKIN